MIDIVMPNIVGLPVHHYDDTGKRYTTFGLDLLYTEHKIIVTPTFQRQHRAPQASDRWREQIVRELEAHSYYRHNSRVRGRKRNIRVFSRRGEDAPLEIEPVIYTMFNDLSKIIPDLVGSLPMECRSKEIFAEAF